MQNLINFLLYYYKEICNYLQRSNFTFQRNNYVTQFHILAILIQENGIIITKVHVISVKKIKIHKIR